MKKSGPISILIIVGIAVLAMWKLYPSFSYYAKSPEERREYRQENPKVLDNVINLGLDLQGGMRLVLEVDRSKLPKEEQDDVLDRAYAVIENRINALGVAEPTIQKQGSDRLIIELPGLSNEEAAKNVIGSTAQLEFKLLLEREDIQKAIRVIDNVMKGDMPQTDTTADEDTADVEDEEEQERAEAIFGGADEAEDTAEGEESVVEGEEFEDEGEELFSEYLIGMQSGMIGVDLDDRAKVQAILNRKDVQDALKLAGLGGGQFLWGHEVETLGNKEYRPLYYVKRRAELRGDIINDATSQIAQGGLDAGQAVVSLELNRQGARKFSRVTGQNVNRFMAIVLDSTVYSAPQIRQKIPNGQAQITGSFTMEEARNLSVVLRAGALPAPVNIIEERTVGPSLGQDSIVKGMYAFLIGLLLVIGFMVSYYKLSGLIADIALMLNVIFLLAIMASISGATLTLPGIAGIILIIGMAVDANVIIFERIREELKIGKTVRSAIDSGYSRAFTTIMDANLTTLITAVILMWVGTGPIRGFAVTLIIGILVSLFTSLYVTRVIYNVSLGSKSIKKLSI